MSPNDGSCQIVLDFEHVLLKRVQCSLVKSHFGIGVGVMINDDCLNWPFKVKSYLVESFFVAYNEIFDFMSNKRFIVEDSIKLLFSNDVLTSEVTGLLNSK